MAVKLLCFSLLLLSLSWAKEQTCLASDSSCDKCIESGPECAWCTAPSANLRCHTLQELQRAGCHESEIYNPQARVQVVRNDSSTDLPHAKTGFLQPQEVSLHLRPGVSQSFPLTIYMPTDQPITELTPDTSNVPSGVNITFSSLMKGNPMLIQVTVEAAQCPSKNQNMTGPWSVRIATYRTPQRVKLDITLQCHCDCPQNREENSPTCGGKGALVGGHCECYEPYTGQHCQIDDDPDFLTDKRFCQSSSNAPVCSGKGTCVKGDCECDRRINPKERYSGKFCECSNFDCPYHNSRMCGGNGKCECRRCICDEGWNGDACDCSTEVASCKAKNQQLCSGRGHCECGACRCEPPFMGPTCEDCPICGWRL